MNISQIQDPLHFKSKLGHDQKYEANEFAKLVAKDHRTFALRLNLPVWRK